jgi:hypothetical protein
LAGHCHILIIQYQPTQDHITGDSRLTRQPDRRVKAQQRGERLLPGVTWGAVFQPVQNQHATGGTTSLATTDVSMWNASPQRCLEDRLGRLYVKLLLIRQIRDACHIDIPAR